MRFPYFTSLWQKNKFGDLLILLKNSTLSRSELNYNNGKIKNIHYGDILIKFNDYILSDSKIIPYVNNGSIPNNYSKLLLKNGDIIIADTAEDNTVGKATEIIFNDKSLIISGLHTITCRPMKNTFASKYLGYYLNSPSFHNQLLPLIQGIKVSSISKSQIVDTQIAYPNIKEQQKIAEILSLIDQRIETQSKIIEDLEYQIKWIRYKIFRNLNNVPNHRLSEFLSEYSEKNSNNAFTPVAVGKHGIRKRNEIYNKELSSDYSKNKVIRQNTLVIGMGSTQIDIGVLSNKETLCVSPAYTTYKINNINASYLNELLIFLNPLLSKKYMIISARQGKSVNKKELLTYKIFVHSNEIQIKIEKLFNLLRFRIQKEKDILELYKKQKAYLLKNMFI